VKACPHQSSDISIDTLIHLRKKKNELWSTVDIFDKIISVIIAAFQWIERRVQEIIDIMLFRK